MSGDRFDHGEQHVLAIVAHEAGRRSLRGVKRLIRPVWMRRLMRRNLESRESVLSAQGPALSLTTYDKRWHSVHYAIESIGSGRLRPSRLVLWVAPSLPQAGVPAPLQRLVARGLEIRTCEDVGPHTKYYPQVCQGTSALGLVTADDDVLYRADWLQTLAAAAARRPGFIHAHRIEMMSFGADGGFAPYTQWPACRGTAPSPLNFFTGVGGVLYPPAMQDALREAGDAFRDCCPRADDIWVNAVAWRNGFQACQTRSFGPLLFEIPGTREHGLARGNMAGGGNDRQLLATYSGEERARLHALALQTRRR